MALPYVMNNLLASSGSMKSGLALFGVIVGLGGGALGMVLGPCLWFCAWFFQDARLSEFSTRTAYVTLPLLFVGGWCLDWYETLTRRRL